MRDRIDCPYGRRLAEDSEIILCQRLSDAAGFKISVCDPHCHIHYDAGGPDVPIDNVPYLRHMLTLDFAARITAGDCPKFQAPNPVDLDDAFLKFASRTTAKQQRQLLIQAVTEWSALPPEDGGHPPEVIEQKAQKIAKDHGLEKVLAAWTERMLA